MPRINGYKLTRQIRAIEQNDGQRPHPILGLMASAQVQLIEECLEAGMTHCLFKPIGMESLNGLLANFCQTIDLHVDAAAATGELQKLRILRPNRYLLLVNELIRTHREDAASLAQRIQTNDLLGLARLAHKIKGSAQFTKASTLLLSCERLEEFALSGNSVQCHQELDVLLQAMDAQVRLLLADL
jgi:two-component system sensor histidine kinase EvgS